MAQHDYVIENQSAPAFRADLNSAFAAIVSQNSGAAAPTVTFANMIWYDTTNNQLKKRNEADSAWITLGTIDEVLGTFTPTGQPVIATQAEAQAGTDNTKMMTPLRTAQAISQTALRQNIATFAASSTWLCPAGVTSVDIVLVGGGGGGGTGTTNNTGPSGGYGALAYVRNMAVTPGTNYTVTLGAGGAANASGGASSFNGVTCGGGVAAGGASGTVTGGATVATTGFEWSGVLASYPFSSNIVSGIYSAARQDEGLRPNSVNGGGNTALAYTFAGTYSPGSGGQGGPAGSSNAGGGVGGALVILF